MLSSFAPSITCQVSKNRRWVAMFKEYKLLEPEDSSSEDEQSLEWRSMTVYFPVKAFVPLLVFLLLTSFALNVGLGYQQFRTRREHSRESPTIYGKTLVALFDNHHNTLRYSTASLFRDVSIPFTVDNVYDSKNRSIADEAWDSPLLVPETGLVAMSDDWVTSKNLPRAQRFPWDESRGLYVLNGFHNMHCLVSSRIVYTLVFLFNTRALATPQTINTRSD